jgi:hypothetical protein
MNATTTAGSVPWTNTIWRIYATSSGLEPLLNAGRPSGFTLQPVTTDNVSYVMEPTPTDGLPSSLELTSAFLPAGTVPTTSLRLVSKNKNCKLDKAPVFGPGVFPNPTDDAVRQYWAIQELFFTEKPLMPKFHRLEGTAKFNGEDHYVDLYQFGNVLSESDKSLLVIRFLATKNDANSDGWAVGHN